MKKLLLALLALVYASAATAATVVPSDFVGINHGSDTTAAGAVYPNYASRHRIWGSAFGATPYAAVWATLNPSNGTYSWTTLDGVLNSAAISGLPTEWTGGKVPTWVSGTQSITGAGITSYANFVSAMMTHVSGNNQCFNFFEHWNEANYGSTWWLGTDADMATIETTNYPIVKAACPNTTVLSSSAVFANAANPAAPTLPQSAWYQYYDVLSLITANGKTGFDALNMHYYPTIVQETPTVNSVKYAPENSLTSFTAARAAGNAAGFSALPIYANEGYGGGVDADSAITPYWAQSQAIPILLAASAGYRGVDPFDYGTGCANQGTCGNMQALKGGPGKTLTLAGQAVAAVTGWLAGATFTTPIARTLGTNLITSAPNVGVTTGKLAGSGSCAGAPAGSAVLPSGWSFSASAGVTGGMNYYVTGSGVQDGLPYIEIRMCGTDTNGAGPNTDSLTFATPTISAAGQQDQFRVCWSVAAGTYAGIQEFDYAITETTNVGGFLTLGQVYGVLPFSGSPANQCYDMRYPLVNGSPNQHRPQVFTKHYTNVATDITYRIASPSLDVGATQWSGVITKSGGYQATIVWDASCSGSFVAPAGTVSRRDIYGNAFPTTAGQTYPTTCSPQIYENQAASYLLQ